MSLRLLLSCLLAVTALATPLPNKVEAALRPRSSVPASPPSNVSDFDAPYNCSQSNSVCPSGGPSGVLKSPTGGDDLLTSYLNDGFVHIVYETVNTQESNYSVYTTSINVSLVATGSNEGKENHFLAVLSPPARGQSIDAYVTLPAQFSDGSLSGGDYNLTITEWQAFLPQNTTYPYAIFFQSAAPQIFIGDTVNP